MRAESRLRALTQEAMMRGAEGTAAYYAKQLAKCQAILSELQDASVPAATQMVGSAYMQGARYAEDTLRIARGGFTGVHARAVEVIADNLVNRLNAAAVTVGRQTEDVFRRIALENVAIGLIEGSTREAVSNAMRRNLLHEGVTAFVDKGGRRWRLSSYTNMVARTTTREAVTHGTANRMLESGHDLVTISEHADEDPLCADYAGNTYSMTGKTPGYDMLGEYPPFHPNCIHVLTPAAATFEAFERSVTEDSAPEAIVQGTVTAPRTNVRH